MRALLSLTALTEGENITVVAAFMYENVEDLDICVHIKLFTALRRLSFGGFHFQREVSIKATLKGAANAA